MTKDRERLFTTRRNAPGGPGRDERTVEYSKKKGSRTGTFKTCRRGRNSRSSVVDSSTVTCARFAAGRVGVVVGVGVWDAMRMLQQQVENGTGQGMFTHQTVRHRSRLFLIPRSRLGTLLLRRRRHNYYCLRSMLCSPKAGTSLTRGRRNLRRGPWGLEGMACA
jgi:hypothetical protein